MGAKTFNNVKINLTLKTTTTRANLSTSSEDLAVQLGKIKKWYDDFAWSAFTAPTVEVTGSGNAITSASWSTSNGKLTLTKGSSFSTVSISRNLTSGTKIGTITIDGVATDLYCQSSTGTDTKVTQTAVGSTYTNYRPLVISAANNATAGFSPSTVTDSTFITAGIYCQPSSGTVYANEVCAVDSNNNAVRSLTQYGLWMRSYITGANASYSYSRNVLRTYQGKLASNNGMLVELNGGGLTIVGGGESATALSALIDDDQSVSGAAKLDVGGDLATSIVGDDEHLILSSDQNIYFITSCNTIANRKPVVLSANSYFYPGTNDTGQIGISTNNWAKAYINDYVPRNLGSTAGDVDTALNATAGTFAWKALNLFGGTADWAGIQVDVDVDKFQIMAFESLFFRQNDSAGDPSSWGSWKKCINPVDVKGSGGITASVTTNTYGTGDNAITYDNYVTLSHTNSITAGTASGDASKTLTWSGTFTIPSVTYDAQGHITSKGTTTMTMPADPQTLSGIYYAGASDYSSKPWAKVYEYDINAASAHRHMSFFLQQGYQTGSSTAEIQLGILMIHVLTTASKEYASGQVFWLAASSALDKDDIAVTRSGSGNCIIQIWIKAKCQYISYHLHPIYSAHLASANPLGSFYSPTAGVAAYEGTLIPSSYTTLKNPASKLGTSNVGGKGIPIYLSSGTPTACSTPASGAWWSTSNALVSQISTAGVLEIGKYIDLHATAASTNNFDYRFEAVGTKEMMFSSADTDNVLTLNTAGYNQIRFKTTATDKSYTATGIVSYPLSASGQTMLFQCGGNMVIGGGEFASGAYNRKDSSNAEQVGYDNIVTTEREKLYLGADTSVEIISNAQNIGTYNNNNHKVWTFGADGGLTTPGSITLPSSSDINMGGSGNINFASDGSIIKPQVPSGGSSSAAIVHDTRNESNYITTIQWTRNGSTLGTYGGSIGFHNTGGDSTDQGAIILIPYGTTTNPWSKNAGLYIGKGILKLDGTDVSLSTHTHNYAASSTAGGTAKGSESWKFTHGNELNVSKLASTYHHCWIGYRFNTDGTEETGDSTYYINEWRFGDCKGGGLARIYPSAVSIQSIVIQTGSSKAQKITLQTLMTWLITTKKYIHSDVNEHVVLVTTFAYADNDILQFTVNGTNMELQLAGVFIEFIGKATSYNSGVFVLKITAAPTNSFTATSGYTKFYVNHTAVYHCNGSGYSPAWSVDSSTVSFISSQSTSSTTKYYPVFAAGISGGRTLFANDGFYYNTRNGTASAEGLSELVLGNGTASGTAGNRWGNLVIYGTGANYAQIRPTTLSANRLQYLPDAGGEIMVRKRTTRTLNQGENTMLNGQMSLYSASTAGGLGYVDAEITGLFTNWSVIMFAITGCGFGTAGSNKFGIHGIVPLDLTKRHNALSVTTEPVVACIQYNPSKTDGLGTVVAQYINDNKIRFSFNITGPQSMLYVYGLY